MSAFDKLEDETPPTTGEEIGAAVSKAIAEVGRASESAAKMIASAMSDAMRSRDEAISVIPAGRVSQWIFDVEHGDDGRITRVVATIERHE